MHDPHSGRMSAGETRAAGGLALVFAFRMLGMFMVLPVLATYGMDLQGSTPALIGLAIGAYGLTQAFLQIPFGMLSDRIGRRPVLIAGLLVYLLATLWMLLAGSMGAAASLAWFTAYAMQGAAAVRTLGMVEVVFSYIVSRKVFSEKLSLTEKLGMALMMLGLVLICLQL